MPMPTAVFNPLDPLGSLLSVLKDAYTFLTNSFEQIIAQPARVSNSGMLPVVYSSQLNLAVYLGYMVTVLALVVFVFVFRKGDRVVKAVGVWIFIGAMGALWIPTVDQMTQLGDDTTAALANIYTPPADATSDIPWLPTDLGWALLGVSNALLGGLALSLYLQSYEFLIIAFKAWAPISWVVGTIGPRFQKLSNMILAVGLVATLVGRPFAVFFMEMGQIAVYTFPLGQTALGGMYYTVGSYYIAALSQIVLMIALYKGVSAIEGFITSKVKGGVEAVIKKTVKVDLEQHRKDRAKPRPTPVVVKKPELTVKSGSKKILEQGVAAAATAALGAATGGSSAVAAKAVRFAGGALLGQRIEPKSKPGGRNSGAN